MIIETCSKKIKYKTSFLSKILGKQNWEVLWKDIKSIKSLPTNQGSKVFTVTKSGENFLVPQRVENFQKF